ncbi:hypothetical protein OEZ86_001826 [Tetradesmus obliquus]|uniref:RIIa domain-containing protein n=1 Tax=Tetradesmus obliquus TaxID=3088 RepID=A0ABY8UA13_TETOB|nr:hypothetical protein OEZ85_009692 [Tetradesmus obliquus]WIA38504.1 hypothetical protein OEZ86_001826 [Tetradesmus obliquus]
MASKYQKPFTIPETYPAILKEFTREVLRAQPDNIYEFGAHYFAELLAKEQAKAAAGSREAGASSSSSQLAA